MIYLLDLLQMIRHQFSRRGKLDRRHVRRLICPRRVTSYVSKGRGRDADAPYSGGSLKGRPRHVLLVFFSCLVCTQDFLSGGLTRPVPTQRLSATFIWSSFHQKGIVASLFTFNSIPLLLNYHRLLILSGLLKLIRIIDRTELIISHESNSIFDIKYLLRAICMLIRCITWHQNICR